MSINTNNPFLLNLIPTFDVANPSGSSSNETVTDPSLTAVLGMINTSTNTVYADEIYPFITDATIAVSGTMSVSGILQVNDNAYFNNNIYVSTNVYCTSVIQSSDERLKQNIFTIEGSLSTLRELRGVHYTMDGSPQVGFIAQEVQRVLPDAVYKMNDTLGVDYSRIIPLLVEAVKELANH